MFDVADLSLGAIILILRIMMVFFLYFFLWQVLRVVTQGLGMLSASTTEQVPLYGQLVVESSGQTGLPVGKVFVLNQVTTIGRSLESDIALNDNFLSSQHARLVLQDDAAWVLEDLGSTNGTFLNGFEVRDATPMKNGDVIRIGRIELKLVS